MKGASFGLEASRLAHSLDLCRERSNRALWLDRCPKCAAMLLFKAPDARYSKLETLGADFSKPISNVVRYRALDLPDKPQRQVKLLIALP